MATKYALISPFLGERFHHDLTKEEFEQLSASQSFLLEYMRFEETVLQCLYSFQDFEEFILKSYLHQYLFPLTEYEFFQDTRVRANIRVLSFLNSVTSLRDQFPKFRTEKNLAHIRSFFEAEWEKQKQNSAAFAFFERVRNYAQHQTQPVFSVTTGGGWDDSVS